MNKRDAKEVGAFDAKTHLAEILRDVESGTSYVITRRGRPVAQLTPIEPQSHNGSNHVAEQMINRRKTLPNLSDLERQTFNLTEKS